MECEETRSAMMDRLDGEATDEAAMEAHLSRCAACRQAWKRMTALERLLQDTPIVPAPAGFVGRTLARIDRKRRIRRAALGGLALAAAVVGGTSLALGLTVWDLSGLFDVLGPLVRAGPVLLPRLADAAGALLRSLCVTVGALTTWLPLLAACGLITAVGANWIWWRIVRRLQPTASHP